MKKLAVIDFETTGLDANSEATEIAVITLDENLQPEKRFSSPINSVAHPDAPSFSQLWQQLAFLLEGRTLVAHKAEFDVPLLQRLLKQIGIDKDFESICTLNAAEFFFHDVGAFTLSALSEELGFGEFDWHHALADCEATVLLLQFLANESPELAAKLYY